MQRVQGVVCVALLVWAVTFAEAQERIVGLPCEGCEAVFVGLPRDIPSVARIAPEGEAGERLLIEGTVRDTSAQPVAGVIIYAYHTDRTGIYPKDEALKGTAAYRHGRLRGWVRSDSAGRYRFETIRPGGYPGSSAPEHIHMHVIEPGRCTYYVADIMFDDDPRLSRIGPGAPPARPGWIRPGATGTRPGGTLDGETRYCPRAPGTRLRAGALSEGQ